MTDGKRNTDHFLPLKKSCHTYQIESSSGVIPRASWFSAGWAPLVLCRKGPIGSPLGGPFGSPPDGAHLVLRRKGNHVSSSVQWCHPKIRPCGLTIRERNVCSVPPNVHPFLNAIDLSSQTAFGGGVIQRSWQSVPKLDRPWQNLGSSATWMHEN